PDGSLAVTVLLKCGWAIAAAAVSSVKVTVAVMALVMAYPPVPPFPCRSLARAKIAGCEIYDIGSVGSDHPHFLKHEAADALHADRQRQARDRGRPRRH